MGRIKAVVSDVNLQSPSYIQRAYSAMTTSTPRPQFFSAGSCMERKAS